MTNNEILRRLRHTFGWNNSQIIAVFAHASLSVKEEKLSQWLKKEDDEAFLRCRDVELATFLNGLIIENRGKKEGPQPVPEKRLSNNIIFKKLKIALDLKSEDIHDIFELAQVELGESELSSYFRKQNNKHYRPCPDNIIDKFLEGVDRKYREDDD